MIYADEELLEQENELNTVAMEIILHAGHAKTLADEAFQLAKEEKFRRSYNLWYFKSTSISSASYSR